MTLLLVAGEGNVDMGITGQDIVMETRLGTPNLNVNELLVRSMYWPKSASVWLTNAQPLRGMIYPHHCAHMPASLSLSFGWGVGAGLRQVRPFTAGPCQGRVQVRRGAIGSQDRHVVPGPGSRVL